MSLRDKLLVEYSKGILVSNPLKRLAPGAAAMWKRIDRSSG